MTKDKFERAKELECSISYLKTEIYELDRVISHGTDLMHVKIKIDSDAVLRNCYGIFTPYLKMYRRDLGNKLSQAEHEFDEL